jgi:hypothetical protein
VRVTVEIEGEEAPLYAASDGSGRFYLEARKGACYALRLENRSGERLGVALTVDGINVISGRVATGRPAGDPGRLYILDPWGTTTVRGWRTSLDEVHRFTFVDERRSYAARSGKANPRMGWIEATVYRERRREARVSPWEPRLQGRARSAEPDAEATEAPEALPSPASERASDEAKAKAGRGAASYPGTGWGRSADDRAVLVTFDPHPSPVQIVTLRYEYAAALRALGVLPRRYQALDRLRQRDSGQDGFVAPPAW